jgi:RimJ/RimL family protein N-acetyltransferase
LVIIKGGDLITLEKATDADLSFILSIRNHPDCMKGFYTQGFAQPHLIQWDEHLAWWDSRPSSWKQYIILNGRPIGILALGQTEHWSPEIGYAIHPSEWGNGYGKEAVRQALDLLRQMGKEYCHTTVLKTNERSLRLLKSLGFTEMADARPGEVWLTCKL